MTASVPQGRATISSVGRFNDGRARKSVRRKPRFGFGELYITIWVAVLFAPIAVLVAFSFNAGSTLSLPFRGFSLRWYQSVLADPQAAEAFVNSMVVASVVTPLCVILGLLSGYAVARLPARWRGVGLGVVSVPLVVPWLVIGIAALLFFRAISLDPSLLSVCLMQTVVTFPLVAVILYGRLIGMDPHIEDAALDLGATRLGVIWRIILPQLAAPLILGGLFAFISSLGNFVVTFFVIGYDLTVPIWAYSSLRHAENLPTVNAGATILFAVNVVAIFAVWLIARRDPESLGWL